MTELQIQKNLNGDNQGFKFAGSKRRKPKVYPEQKKSGLFNYAHESEV